MQRLNDEDRDGLLEIIVTEKKKKKMYMAHKRIMQHHGARIRRL